MKKIFYFLIAAAVLSSCTENIVPDTVTMSKEELLDRIKGGWAGQTIGCTYGGPTEFKYKGTMIQDYVPIRWWEGCVENCFVNGPGLYDDVYMDLTFVDVFDRLGLDAPADSFAVAFARAGYTLWHANQAARYNILHGIMPPESGHWLNNPHADDLDYQIEADYAGLMAPGMPNSASEISDRIGHIMNYGDGWYGGVFVGAMYSLAFVLDDVEDVVAGALETIPEQSRFHSCISDVIKWHRQYPDDWKQTWFECERKYSEDIGCPDGVLVPYNIDAVINSAYVVIGLLYGEGDFFRTMDIATRCGQDSDCNPATAAGVLGTMIGYSRIPEVWKKELYPVEDMDFAYTDISLDEAYGMSLSQALELIALNGGSTDGDRVVIRCQTPVSVRYEKCFDGMYPVRRTNVDRFIGKGGPVEFSFDGTGFVLRGSIKAEDNDYSALIDVYLDGKLCRTMDYPADFNRRSQEVCWQYGLAAGHHEVRLVWTNPVEGVSLHCGDLIVYDDEPYGCPSGHK